MTDPIVDAALFLAGHVEYARHQPWADEFLTDVADCARALRSVVNGRAEQKYLGPCGAMDGYMTPDGPVISGAPCDGDVYAYRGARVGRCRTCGAEVATSEREAWLDAEVRAHAFRDREIADAYGVNVKTIRTWVGRGHLVPHGHDAEGRPLLNVGDVLDLAAADAARRETDRAKRARRRDTKTEEDAA